MNSEETVKWLLEIKTKYIHGGDDDFDKKRKEAIDAAIRSFEAWDRVFQKFYDHHYEILREDESISKAARLSLSNWVLDTMLGAEKEVEE